MPFPGCRSQAENANQNNFSISDSHCEMQYCVLVNVLYAVLRGLKLNSGLCSYGERAFRAWAGEVLIFPLLCESLVQNIVFSFLALVLVLVLVLLCTYWAL